MTAGVAPEFPLETGHPRLESILALVEQCAAPSVHYATRNSFPWRDLLEFRGGSGYARIERRIVHTYARLLPSYVRPVIDMHVHPPFESARTEAMLEAAQRVGITRIIMNGLGQILTLGGVSEYPSLEEVSRFNQEVYALAGRHPGFVYGLVYVNPNLCEALSILEEGLRQPGMVGIKLWTSCRDDGGRLNPVYAVLEFAQAQRVPVLIHAFYRTGGNLRGELSPTDIAHLAQRYPGAPIVMAHMGGLWQRGVRVVRPYANVFADIAGSRAYLGSVEYAVRELGVGRVLFGSDAYPRAFAGQLAKVVAAEIDLTDKRQILWDNSAHLFFGEGERG